MSGAPWWMLLTGAAAAFWPGPHPSPGPADPRAACAGCHADIAAEQARSFHARSWTDPMFQRSFAREPQRFCRDCHAPAATGDSPRAALLQAGVTCVGCHGDPSAPLAAPAPADRGRAPHAVRRDPRFGTSTQCAGCHEFTFPDETWRREPAWMQTTVAEHAASPYDDRACAGCHMPPVDGPRGSHRSHDFHTPHDPAALRAALHVVAHRDPDDGRLWLALSVDDVGHAFPSGDLFRRLEVLVEAVGPDHAVITSQRRFLARHWGRERGLGGLPVRVVASDDRPRPGSPAVLRLDLGPAALPWPVAYRITYQRPIAVRDDAEDTAEVFDEVVLCEGELPAALP